MQCRWLTATASGLVLTLLPLLSGLAVESTASRVAESKEKVAPVVILQAEPFRLQDVQLLDGPFKHAMELDRKYLLSLDADRLLHVFRLSAGLPSTARPYGGWMAPDHVSRGEFVGLYLSACAEMYAGTGDEQVKKKGDQVVAGLAECQRKIGTGFLHTHADSFTSRCEAPLPFWYQIHKVMAGLMDMNVYCDNRQALEIAGKLGDWACRSAEKWTDAQIQKMLDLEHGGINEALANLYALNRRSEVLEARVTPESHGRNWPGIQTGRPTNGLACQYADSQVCGYRTPVRNDGRAVAEDGIHVLLGNGRQRAVLRDRRPQSRRVFHCKREALGGTRVEHVRDLQHLQHAQFDTLIGQNRASEFGSMAWSSSLRTSPAATPRPHGCGEMVM